MLTYAYDLGYEAYWEYKTREDNPYKSGVDLHQQRADAWEEGFFDARDVYNGDA